MKARKNLRSGIPLYDRRGDVPEGFFDAVTLMCMLHGNRDIITECTPYLRDGGHLVVLDHDKSHLSREEFEYWVCDADRDEINVRGFEEVFRDHTTMKIDDCRSIAHEQGYETVMGIDHDELEGYPFYLWVGQKNGQ